MTAGCGCQRVGSPCCPHCRGKAENSHVAPLAAAREQVPGQVCTAGGSLRRQAPRPPPLPGAHATVFTSLSKHGQVMHSPSLLPPTVTTDLLSSCSLPRGPRWLPQHEASHLYTAVSNRKRWGGGRGRRFPEAPRQIPPQTPLRRPGPRATLASGAGEANVWLGRPARPSPAEAGTGTVASDKIGVHLGGKWKGRLWGRLLTCLPQ